MVENPFLKVFRAATNLVFTEPHYFMAEKASNSDPVTGIRGTLLTSNGPLNLAFLTQFSPAGEIELQDFFTFTPSGEPPNDPLALHIKVDYTERGVADQTSVEQIAQASIGSNKRCLRRFNARPERIILFAGKPVVILKEDNGATITAEGMTRLIERALPINFRGVAPRRPGLEFEIRRTALLPLVPLK